MVQHSISWADLHELAAETSLLPGGRCAHHRHIMGNKQIAEPIALTQIFQQRRTRACTETSSAETVHRR